MFKRVLTALLVSVCMVGSALAQTPWQITNGWIPGVNPNSVLATGVPQLTITGISGVPAVALGGSGDTISVYAEPSLSGAACGDSNGTLLHSGSFNANGTAGVVQNLTLTNTNVPSGDWLCMLTTGSDWTASGAVGQGAITIFATAAPPPVESIASLTSNPSSLTAEDDVASGTQVGRLTVNMNQGTFSGTLALATNGSGCPGTNNSSFAITGSAPTFNLTTNAANLADGTDAVCVEATESAASNSPQYFAFNVVVSAQTIASASLSGTTFLDNVASGTAIGNASAVMSPATPAFSGTWSLGTASGCTSTNNSDFNITTGGALTTGVANLAAGSYDVCILATQSEASNSPLATHFVLTSNAPTPALCETTVSPQIASSSSATTISATFGSPVTSGCSVLVGISFNDGGTTTASCTDDKSNTYTAGNNTYDSSGTQRARDFYALNVTNGPKTITCTLSPTQNGRGIIISAVSNLASLDVKSGKVNTTSTTANGTSVTPTVNGEFLWGWVAAYGTNPSSMTAGSPFTLDVDNGFPAATVIMGDETDVQATAAAVTPKFTFGTGADSIVSIMAFKP